MWSARAPDGRLVTEKLLSDDPEHYDDAVVEGIRRLLGLAPGEPLPAGTIEAVRMGTTVATNALLERKGDRVVLAITKGFGDALRIGYQNRPKLFARHIVLPEMLYERVIEIDERIDAAGAVLTPLDEDAARRASPRRSPTASMPSPSCCCMATATRITKFGWRRSPATSASPRSRSATPSAR